VRHIYGLGQDLGWTVMGWDIVCEPTYGLGEDGGLTVMIWDIVYYTFGLGYDFGIIVMVWDIHKWPGTFLVRPI
jgi:hypothetical protein